MASYNKITVMGRLTKDPEIKYTTSGKQLCNLSIAVDRKFQKNKNNKETDFFNLVAWDKLSVIICK